MAYILHKSDYNFKPNPNKIEPFQLFTDITRSKDNIKPKYLDFDVRQLNPGEFSAPYHYHRYSDEMFYIISGHATLRTPEGLTEVSEGDILFFEAGENSAHQLGNQTDNPCVYLDLRTSIGYDIVIYPDSDKLITVPEGEVFSLKEQKSYFAEESHVKEIWEKLKNVNR